MKEVYILWFGYYKVLPKANRYSLGKRVDDLFVVSIEMIAQASFLPREKKLPYIQCAIRKVDTIKVFLLILWETKSLDNKKYIALSVKLDEIGRMLGGWSGQTAKYLQQIQDKHLRQAQYKQNSPHEKRGEK